MGDTNWENEAPFNAHWIPTLGQLMIFNYGNSLGFDQVCMAPLCLITSQYIYAEYLLARFSLPTIML